MMTGKHICLPLIAGVLVSITPVLSQSDFVPCEQYCVITPSARPVIKCLHLNDVCNGVRDCYYGEDELNCNDESTAATTETPNALTTSFICGPDKFQCSEMECIAQRLVCDRFADCSNGRDEESCTSRGLLREDLARPGTYGRYFVFAWPETFPERQLLKISMIGVTNETSVVTISIRNTPHSWNLDVPAHEHVWHDIDWALATDSSNEFANITIDIQSNFDISVFAVFESAASVGAFQLIPKESLGKEYFVPLINHTFFHGVATVSALSESTHIIISFSTQVVLRGRDLRPGEQIAKSLHPFETFQAKVMVPGSHSVTIMHIVADKPVAVASGSICARIPPVSLGTCDYLAEQFPPFSQWGRRFTVPPFSSRNRYSLLIVAGRNNTEVNWRNATQYISTTLQKGDFRMFALGEVETHVTSSEPTLIVSFSTSNIMQKDGDGDPAMIIVPPHEQFIRGEQYFYIPSILKNTKHYISITATCNSIMDFILDTTPVNSVNSTSPVVKGSMCISNLPIDNGSHTIRHRSNNASYMLTSYGFNIRSGYGRLISFNTRPITCQAYDEIHDVIEYKCDDLEKSFCPEEVTDGNITWPQSGIFTTVKSEEVCSLYFSKAGEPVRARRCILTEDPLEVKWEEPVIGCGDPKPVETPKDLETTIVTTENVEEVSSTLESVTKEIDDITTEDVVAVSETLTKVVETGSSSPQVTESVVQTVGTVMTDLSLSDSKEQDGGNLERTETAMSTSAMVQLMEQQIHQSLEVIDDFTIIEESIQVQAFNLKVEEVEENVALTPPEVQTAGDAHTSAILPRKAFDLQVSTVAVSFVLYRDDSLFRTTSDKFKDKRAPELVLSISVGTMEVHMLKEPVVLNFPTPKDDDRNISDNTSCVFWDFQLNGGSGDWSDEGCDFKGATNQSVTCECNHLTNFAVLMDYMDMVDQPPVPYQNFLNVLTIIGCILSILGLTTTLIVFFTFKRLRSSRPRRILVHLCIALLCLYCTFLFGVDTAINSKWACPMVGALIHYFLLSTIFWMGVEALNIYLMLVRVFNMNIRRFILKSALVAWGTPVLVVGVCLIFATEQYQKETYCFLTQGRVFFMALIAPMALVLSCNMFIFFLVIRNLMTSNMAGTIHRKKTEMDMLRERLQNAITMTILMGLTWTFGFLMFGHTAFIFQLLFCLFNSFQGFLVFILFCWRQEDVRKTLKPHCVSAKRKGKEAVGAKADYDVTNSMTGQHTTGMKVSIDTRKNIVSTTSTSSTILLSPNKVKMNNNQKNPESHV